MSREAGIVYLVGAGPGDPGLLTRRGESLLRQADVVVYDRLVSPALVELSPPGAERVFVGKEGGGPSAQQNDIMRLLVERGRSGLRVVRLKGGDPFVFGRGGEEAVELRAAGLPFEIVPGVSSAIAGPAYAGIPVTHRGVASTVAITTGHEDPTKPGPTIDWQALARAADTVVVLMGVEQLEHITRQLLEAGRGPEQPAALIRWATTPNQSTLTATLGTIAERAHESGLRPPAVLVVGEVVSLRRDVAWFERRPLLGRRVLVTRAREQASALSQRLSELGAEPIEFPTIAIRPLADTSVLDSRLCELGSYDWAIFTSANGVHVCFERLEALGRDARSFGRAQVGAIGPATAAVLRERGIRADFVPTAFTSDGILRELTPRIETGQRVLLLRADIAPRLLSDGLAVGGAIVENVEAYRTIAVHNGRGELRDLLARGQVDVVTFTSSSTVSNLLDAVGGEKALLGGTTIACIGPVTAATARDHGLEVELVAETHTIDGLIECLVERFGSADSQGVLG